MPAPAFWKGYLKLSLVTCPVSLSPATSESEKVRFHTINRKSGRRVRSQYVDSETGKPVREGDEMKGYETTEGQFVTFTDDELQAVRLESVRTIDIESFVAADEVPWIYYDSPYFVLPTDKVGEEAYAVIREAMLAKKVVGLSRLVMFRRERSVLVEARDNGLVLWTLRYGEEVRDAESYFENAGGEKPDSKLLTMIEELIDERSDAWDPKMVQDPVQRDLKKLIASKQKTGTAPKTAPERPAASNVVDLMAALKKSMERANTKPGKR